MAKLGRPRTNTVCSVDGCEKMAAVRQLCRMHLNRMARHGSVDAVHTTESKSLREAFEEYMPGPPPPAGVLWLWTGNVGANGYGRLRADGKRYVAHRAAYELFNGPIPKGVVVRHTNDTPLDVNPHHLILGTTKNNVEDMVERERQARGQRQHLAKLTETEVLTIRARHAAGESIYGLARAYGMGETSIRNVVRRGTWKHI